MLFSLKPIVWVRVIGLTPGCLYGQPANDIWCSTTIPIIVSESELTTQDMKARPCTSLDDHRVFAVFNPNTSHYSLE